MNLRYRVALTMTCLGLMGVCSAQAQDEDPPLRIFGFFQNSFTHQSGEVAFEGRIEDERRYTVNSFVAQQLNLFAQKDFLQHWTAFVNLEFINSFSSRQGWGAFSLEEAWVGYRPMVQLNLKLGLQVPPFNYLNEIKNRMPLLPYVVRPIVYEASYAEIIADEDYLPRHAYAQVYGFIPVSYHVKLDYAAYLGNSPNISSDLRSGLTGTDTSATFLGGGRLGVRLNNPAGLWGSELRAGVSVSRDIVEDYRQLLSPTSSLQPEALSAIPRTRLGTDVRVQVGRVSFEGEYIAVTFDEDAPGFAVDRTFYYGTLGMQATERLFVFASYWDVSEHTLVEPEEEELDFAIPNVGVAFDLNDRVRLKAQAASVTIRHEVRLTEEQTVALFPGPVAVRGEEQVFYGALAVSIHF